MGFDGERRLAQIYCEPLDIPAASVGLVADLYGAFPVKRLFLGFPHSSLFGAGKAVLRPVACDQVPGARGRGQGTETLV